MNAAAAPPVLTRDWLTGYFRVYPLGPAVRRYEHSRIASHMSAQRQQRNLDHALTLRDDDGCVSIIASFPPPMLVLPFHKEHRCAR